MLCQLLSPNEVAGAAREALRLVPDAVEVGTGPAMGLRAALHPLDREVPRAIVLLLPLPRASECFVGGAAERWQTGEVAGAVETALSVALMTKELGTMRIIFSGLAPNHGGKKWPLA